MYLRFTAIWKIASRAIIKFLNMKKLATIILLMTSLNLYSQGPQEKHKMAYISCPGYTLCQNQKNYFSPNVLTLRPNECNYLAVFNTFTMSYNFYPSKVDINFNLYSPRIACQNFNPIKIDSFNPYGANSPGVSIILGCLDLLMKKL